MWEILFKNDGFYWVLGLTLLTLIVAGAICIFKYVEVWEGVRKEVERTKQREAEAKAAEEKTKRETWGKGVV